MDAQENTREGGTERTAAAGSASRDFHVGDRAITKIGGEFVRCTIARIVDVDYFAIDTGNLRTYRCAHELTPIADAPTDVVAATQDTP